MSAVFKVVPRAWISPASVRREGAASGWGGQRIASPGLGAAGTRQPAKDAFAAQRQKPVVPVPVTAGDFAMRKWRIRLAVAAAMVVAAIGGGLTYKHLTDPLHARDSYETGVSLLQFARNSQAILSFNRAIELNPGFADAYLMRGKAYRADGDLEHAIEDFGKVIALRPSDPGALLDRCSALLERKNYRAAISDATQALDLEPKLALAYNLRGSAIRGAGDLPRAIQEFDRAIALQPNPDNYFERGATYQLLGDHARAIADFDQVIRFLPDKSSAYFARALSRRALGDAEGAGQDHQRGRILDGRGQ